MSAEPVRWGVLGAGSMIYAKALRPALVASGSAELLATASRSGPGHGGPAPRRYGSYEALLADADVEAVYIPLPNDLHEPWTVAAAEAGKHVLCEKPLAPDADGARRMADVCAAAGVVLAEAYMTPFHPRSARWDALLADGELGEPRHGMARFCFPHDDPSDHRWRASPGGGALLDVGIYCIEPLLAVGGWRRGDPPPRMGAAATWRDGVDASFSGWLALPSGFTGAFLCSFEAPEAQVLEVVGTDSVLRVEPAFTPTTDDRIIAVTNRDGSRTTVQSDPGAMYELMVEHVNAVIRGTQQLRRPPEDSIALAEIVDQLRAAAAIGP